MYWILNFYFIFRKFVTKNRAFGNNTIFLQQFFRFRRGGFPPFPLATPLPGCPHLIKAVHDKVRLFRLCKCNYLIRYLLNALTTLSITRDTLTWVILNVSAIACCCPVVARYGSANKCWMLVAVGRLPWDSCWINFWSDRE